VAAIGNGADIFNETIDATIAAMTSIVNTEGFQELDIDKTGAAGQEFYSQWDTGTQTVNETYERSKWISQRSHEADATQGTPTGADFVIDNAAIVGQGQSFIPLSGTELLTEARANLKILADAGALVGTVYAELWDSDDAGSQLSEPIGGALARSEDILISEITTTYEEVIFKFNRFNPIDGTDQVDGLQLTNAEYFIVFRHLDGDASNNLSLEGASTDQDSTMNQADDTAAVWTASATDDINITVKSSPIIHGLPGEIFQGINVDVGFDGEVGAGVLETNATTDELAIWGTEITYDGGASLPFHPGEYVKIERASVVVSGGEVLFDDGTDQLIVALENPAASVILDGDVLTGLQSGATCVINTTIVDEDLSGGSGYVLAKDDNGVDGELYLQVISGSNPVENNRIRSTAGDPMADYADATVTIVTRTIIPEFLGTSTGSNIIGAYGIGFDPDDVGSSDRFTSLDNGSSVPPNNVVFTVSGLVSGEDRVLVAPRLSTALDRGQWLLSTALSGAGEVAVVVKTGTDTVPWPANKINWPATGLTGEVSALRIELDSGIYKNVDYDSHDSSGTFTIQSTSFTGVNVAAVDNNVFLAFIDVLAGSDTETFTGVHAGADRDLFVRVRDGGGTPIKTFEATSAQFLSTPQTIAATRTADA
jgi:hypothetical protein